MDADARKILYSTGCADEAHARAQFDVPPDLPYLGVWHRDREPWLPLHLFGAAMADIAEGWRWIREEP